MTLEDEPLIELPISQATDRQILQVLFNQQEIILATIDDLRSQETRLQEAVNALGVTISNEAEEIRARLAALEANLPQSADVTALTEVADRLSALGEQVQGLSDVQTGPIEPPTA